MRGTETEYPAEHRRLLGALDETQPSRDEPCALYTVFGYSCQSGRQLSVLASPKQEIEPFSKPGFEFLELEFRGSRHRFVGHLAAVWWTKPRTRIWLHARIYIYCCSSSCVTHKQEAALFPCWCLRIHPWCCAKIGSYSGLFDGHSSTVYCFQC